MPKGRLLRDTDAGQELLLPQEPLPGGRLMAQLQRARAVRTAASYIQGQIPIGKLRPAVGVF